MPASSFNDIFLVPSLNSFHRRSKAKAPVKKAVWQKHTPRTTTTSDATAPRPVVRTPPVVAAEERVVVQLPTPVTASNKDTGSVAQQVAPRRAFSLTRFTDPLPSPIRSPLCRLSVLEFAAPSHRMPLKIAEVVQVAQENTGVEVEIEIEEVAEVEVKEAVVRPSRIPVWKGRTTHCSECGEPKIFSERGQRVEEEANVAEVADEHSAPDAAPAVPETTEPASLPVGQSSTRVAEPAAALPETSGATNVEPAPEAANTNKDIRAKLGESFEDPQSTAPEDTVSDNEESPSPVVAQDEETQQQIPEPAALTARDEDTTPANIVTRSTPWTPLSLPRIKKTAAKKSSLLSRIFSKVKAPFTPTPTSEQPVQDPVDSAKFAVLNELMQFNCEGRKLRKYIRPELLVAVDPVLDAFSVTPEADAIIREASVLDVLFEYDASFEAEEAREKGAEATPEKGEAKSVEVKERAKEAEEVAGGTTATIPSFALSESTNDDPDTTDSEPILGSPEETAVSILKDGSPVEPVPVCQPETENAPAALVVPPTEEREEEPAPVVMKAFGTELTNTEAGGATIVPPPSVAVARRHVLSETPAAFVPDTPLSLTAPAPAMSSVQARIFALNRNVNAAAAATPLEPSGHIRKLRAPAWADRDYSDKRTQREIDALRCIGSVKRGGEVILKAKAFGGSGVDVVEEVEVEGGKKKVLSLSAMGVLLKHRERMAKENV